MPHTLPVLSFYHRQVLQLRDTIYPKAYLTEQIIAAKKYVDVHFSENINLDGVARQAFISKFHFIRIFKNYYGRTPYQYLIEIRIGKAKQFLRSGNSVTTTCFAVGFISVSSFTSLFYTYYRYNTGGLSNLKSAFKYY